MVSFMPAIIPATTHHRQTQFSLFDYGSNQVVLWDADQLPA
ncbi:MAG: hypothetical protein OJF49_002741 [Ktedonobacterales bacterium]|jgi:hypothetical protein|nr:MAG: hypothetical protein OJF49_002741 [Ktedonobacterales bacterium]